MAEATDNYYKGEGSTVAEGVIESRWWLVVLEAGSSDSHIPKIHDKVRNGMSGK